ncbi:MAG: hypothetical protein IEMM0002_1177 [bacterium]|nr:MAG: hypothetical protein IEMM0002_1177 [bacterium]
MPDKKASADVGRLSGNFFTCVRGSVPVEITDLLEKAAVCADKYGFTAYAVGGFVRDLLAGRKMGRKSLDVDIAIEGDGIEFARRFTNQYGGKLKTHKRFKTAIVMLKGSRKIDVATARTEIYTEPAALPIVEMSSIKNDLYRRDFTINAMAVKLNGDNKNQLIDFFGGQQDLKDGALRILHDRSFVEDPTRLFRAIRFEQRFNFAIEANTKKFLKLAATGDLIDKISGARLFNELNVIFSNEEHPSNAMQRMREFGLWKLIYPHLMYDKKIHRLCRQAEEAIAWHKLSFDTERIRPWFIYLLCLSSALDEPQSVEFFKRLGFDRHPVKRIIEARRKAADCIDITGSLTPAMSVEIYEALNGLSADVMLAVMAASGERQGKKVVAEFMSRLRYITPRVKGGDLIRAGIESGPLMGRVMRALQMEVIKNTLPTKEDEIRFSKNFYRLLKESAGNI